MVSKNRVSSIQRLSSLVFLLLVALVLVFFTSLLLTVGSKESTQGERSGYGINVTVEPPANSHTAALDTDVSVFFSGDPYPGSVTTSTFPVYGAFHGRMDGVYSENTGSVVLNPNEEFLPGEEVDASFTADIPVDGLPLGPYVWQFRAEVGGGSGRFVAHPSTPLFGAQHSQDVELGDLDGDGDLDALVLNSGYTNSVTNTVWLNDGNGSFTYHPPDLLQEDGHSGDAELGDLDGDGDLDFVVAANWGFWTWDNDGSAGFTSTGNYGGMISTLDVDLGDLDGDGDLDAVVVHGFTQDHSVWLNDGAGIFAAHPVSPTFGTNNFGDAVALGDLDGDGDLDAVVANSTYTTFEKQTTWLNNGSGGFYPHPTTPDFGAGNSRDLELGDLDGDGDLDALVVNFGRADGSHEDSIVWMNDGTGSFSLGVGLAGQSDWGADLGDIDGDGDLDIVIASLTKYPQDRYGGATHVWLNDGEAGFSQHSSLPHFGDIYNYDVSLGDLDGDGDLDAVFARFFDKPESVYLNQNAADLVISKSATPGDLAPGQTVTYTLSYTNEGPQLATGVVVTDIVPSVLLSLTIQASDPDIWPRPGVSFAWEIGELEPGAGGIITLTGVLTDGLAAGTEIENWANIDGGPLIYNDPVGNSSQGGVTVLNIPPTAILDHYGTPEDTTLIISAPGVLVNDFDRNSDPITTLKVGEPGHGTVELNLDGSFTYTPTGDYYGPDFFSYQAYDGIAPSATVMVTLSITPDNDAPTIEPILDRVALPGVALGPILVIVADIDTLVGDLLVSATSSDQSVVENGSILVGGSGAQRTLTITPLESAGGKSATITVTVSDGDQSAVTTFDISVESNKLFLPIIILAKIHTNLLPIIIS